MPKVARRSMFALLSAGLVACGGSPITIEVPSVGDAVTTAATNIADNLSDGPHLGFDTYAILEAPHELRVGASRDRREAAGTHLAVYRKHAA